LYCIVCKGWARIHPALALPLPTSVMLALPNYLFVIPTLLMKRRIFRMGASWQPPGSMNNHHPYDILNKLLQHIHVRCVSLIVLFLGTFRTWDSLPVQV
jgi:hypothetical protein